MAMQNKQKFVKKKGNLCTKKNPLKRIPMLRTHLYALYIEMVFGL